MNPASVVTPAGGLGHWTRATPDRLAVTDGEESLTFAELDELVARTASALADLGVRRGEVVAMSLRNGVEALLLPLAAARLGAMISCVSFRLRRRELEPMLRLSRPRVLVHGDDVAAEVQACELPRPTRALTREELRTLTAGAEPRAHTASGFAGPSDPYTLMWTSGTGGAAKAVVGSLLARMNWITSIAHVYGLSARDRFLSAMPIMHSAGLTFALAHLHFGASVHTVARFEPRHVWSLLLDGRVTTGLYVPTMLQMLVDEDPDPDRAAPAVRAVVMAGSRLRRSLHTRLLQRFPGCLYNYYGSTESPSMTVLCPGDQEEHPDSVGRPFMGVELEVRNLRSLDGQPQPVGEIVARNPFAMDRYLDDADPDPFDAGGFLRTGDLGFLDSAGFLHVVGRESEVIISGGLNVSLPEVERVIAAHPDVRDVAVVGVDDDVWGQVPGAVVVFAPGVDEAEGMEALERHCRAELADYKRPRHQRAVAALPRTASGKPHVPELRRMLGRPALEVGGA